MGLSGSMNYTAPSGSFYATGTLFDGARKYRASSNSSSFFPPSITTTITESLTVKYFQRVFDAGLSVYCYYTKTSIDPTPLSTETSPEYTGAISDHSVVKILEIY